MGDDLINLLWRVADARDIAKNGGDSLLHPDYSPFVVESKRIIFIKVPEPMCLDDLICALILTFEKMAGADIESGLANAEASLKTVSSNIQILKDVLEIKKQVKMITEE